MDLGIALFGSIFLLGCHTQNEYSFSQNEARLLQVAEYVDEIECHSFSPGEEIIPFELHNVRLELRKEDYPGDLATAETFLVETGKNWKNHSFFRPFPSIAHSKYQLGLDMAKLEHLISSGRVQVFDRDKGGYVEKILKAKYDDGETSGVVFYLPENRIILQLAHWIY